MPKRPHTLPLHRLAWAVNRSETAFKIYSNESISLTLLAPDDEALTPPHRRGGPHHGEDFEVTDGPDANPMDGIHPFLSEDFMTGLDSSVKEDDDKKDRHARFQKILAILLRYTTLPGSHSTEDLLERATIATALRTSKDKDAEHFRIRVGARLFPRPALSFNAYSRVKLHVKAKNGTLPFFFLTTLTKLK